MEQGHIDWHGIAAELARGTPAERLAARQGFVLTHAQARAAGVGTAEVRRLTRCGTWTVPRRGVLCVLPDPVGSSLPIRASSGALAYPRSAISHESAAAARGLPLLHTPDRATLTRRFRCNAARTPDTVVYAADLRPVDVGRWFGMPITTVARTVTDLARHGGLRAGLVAADAALFAQLLTTDDLASAVVRERKWRGSRTAIKVLELATPLSESPLESLARLFLHTHGIPLPAQQVWIETDGGLFRVDALWRDRGVVLELDGLTKYRDEYSLIAEKRRQEYLERAGYRVIRVTWYELHHEPVETERRIRFALRAGGRRAVPSDQIRAV